MHLIIVDLNENHMVKLEDKSGDNQTIDPLRPWISVQKCVVIHVDVEIYFIYFKSILGDSLNLYYRQ